MRRFRFAAKLGADMGRERSPAVLDEFDLARGESQRAGDPNVLGLGRPLPDEIPVGLAPGFPRHVYSTFDSRPIGAWDFTQSVRLSVTPDPGQQVFFTFQVPEGLVAFLRRVDVTLYRPMAINASVVPDAALRGLEFNVSRDRVPIPYSQFFVYSGFSSLSIPAAVLYDPNQEMNLRMVVHTTGEFLGWLEAQLFIVTFIGTMIPYTGEAAAQMAGSDETPVLRRLVNAFLESRFNRLVKGE